MLIIKLTAESNGAHANQTGMFETIPDGYADVPENLISVWEQYKPFVTLTVGDGGIAGIVDNSDARAAQAALDANTEQPIDELTLTQLAIAELAEAQEAAQTNTQLALAELAEMITGGVS